MKVDGELNGLSVNRLELSFVLQIVLSDGSEIALSKSSTITRNNQIFEFDPDDGRWPKTKAAGVNVLVGQTIADISEEAGSLTVSFDSGDVLHVPRDHEYEPWEIAMTDGRKWISYEDGSIAYWGPR